MDIYIYIYVCMYVCMARYTGSLHAFGVRDAPRANPDDVDGEVVALMISISYTGIVSIVNSSSSTTTTTSPSSSSSSSRSSSTKKVLLLNKLNLQ